MPLSKRVCHVVAMAQAFGSRAKRGKPYAFDFIPTSGAVVVPTANQRYPDTSEDLSMKSVLSVASSVASGTELCSRPRVSLPVAACRCLSLPVTVC